MAGARSGLKILFVRRNKNKRPSSPSRGNAASYRLAPRQHPTHTQPDADREAAGYDAQSSNKVIAAYATGGSGILA